MHHGRATGSHFLGWCYIWKRSLYERIGPLPEDYAFYCADNVVSEVLMKEESVAHALFSEFRVEHLGNKTFWATAQGVRKSLTVDCVKKWNKDRGQNKFNWGT